MCSVIIFLFSEYAGENSLTLATNSVTFCNILGAGSPVTVLAARSSSKYRLQSDSLASINLMTYELNRRLTKHFESSNDFKIKHSSAIPTKIFLEIVEKHFSKRQKFLKIQVILQNTIMVVASGDSLMLLIN